MVRPNILLYKWLIANSFAALLVYIAWLQDWITLVFESDASYLSVVILVAFIVFWLISSYQIINLNREVGRFLTGASIGVAADYFGKLRHKAEKLHGHHPLEQGMLAAALRARLILPAQMLNYVANMLLLLGLIGTVVGFVIAVGGLGDSLAGGSNLQRIQSVLGQIVNGMGVALFTTLVGSILGGLWLQLHYQMLARAVGGLVVEIVERADVDVIPELSGRGYAPAE
jgi:hypothetical protein